MYVVISDSEEFTEQLAEKIAEKLNGGEVIAFRGGLGAGKTCFTRGLARGLGYVGTVTSPTFALVNEYRGGRLNIFHFDMYRVEGWESLYSTGYFDYLDEGGVVVAEWSENIDAALEKKNTIYINIEVLSDTTRKITIDGVEGF